MMAKMLSFLLLLLLLLACALTSGAPRLTIPEQIHLSYGDEPTKMRVTWSTMDYVPRSLVRYRMQGSRVNQTASGTVRKFVDGGNEHHTQFIHSVLLTDLKPATLYYYECGWEGHWSPVFHFRTLGNGGDWSPHFVVYGDFGINNDVSLPYLVKDVQAHNYDVILHVGDFAYNMDTDNARRGDEFMNMIQPVAAYVPYMTCPGNHEYSYNFSNYKYRFVMPGDEDSTNMFYSFNMGPVHIVSYSTEFYYESPEYTAMKRQHDWIEKDLQEANKPENRAERPWIIAMGHRPMYCSNSDDDDCTKYQSRVKNGYAGGPGIEDLFYKYGVDLICEAHEHSYERLWPMYNYTIMNGSYEHPYTNPRAPVHIVTGSAGCQEDLDPFVYQPQPWSAFRCDDYGYTRMNATRTHLDMEQISVDKGGFQVVDKVSIIKDKHGPYQ